MIRIAAVLALALGLSACADATRDLAGPTEPMGDFVLGYVAAVAEKPEPAKLLVSRDATADEWIAVVDAAAKERFERFEGDKLYHLGLKVMAYSLPPPVVPGKSALHLVVTIFDDANCIKMNSRVHDVMVIQIFESRLNLTREEQMQRLAQTAVKDVESWLREKMESDGWFTADYVPPADAPSVAGGCGA